ncbi:MAG: hypothetical protein R3F15_00065 [Lysobacterales bacterium]
MSVAIGSAQQRGDLLFAATHVSIIGLLCRYLWPAHSGETMHALTQLGTIAFAYLLRQALRWRFERQRGQLTAAQPG